MEQAFTVKPLRVCRFRRAPDSPALLEWYGQVQPDQALGYETPQGFYEEWTDKYPVEKDGIVRHLLTQCRPLTLPGRADSIW